MKMFFRNYYELTAAVERLADDMEGLKNAERDKETAERE